MKELMKFEGIESLEAFAEECGNYLKDEENIKTVTYNPEHITHWNHDAIKSDNEDLLNGVIAKGISEKEINASAIIYFIYTTNKKAENDLKYIGQRKGKGGRTRLTDHLINKHDKTGSKLQSVKDSVRDGESIKNIMAGIARRIFKVLYRRIFNQEFEA